MDYIERSVVVKKVMETKRLRWGGSHGNCCRYPRR